MLPILLHVDDIAAIIAARVAVREHERLIPWREDQKTFLIGTRSGHLRHLGQGPENPNSSYHTHVMCIELCSNHINELSLFIAFPCGWYGLLTGRLTGSQTGRQTHRRTLKRDCTAGTRRGAPEQPCPYLTHHIGLTA